MKKSKQTARAMAPAIRKPVPIKRTISLECNGQLLDIVRVDVYITPMLSEKQKNVITYNLDKWMLASSVQLSQSEKLGVSE